MTPGRISTSSRRDVALTTLIDFLVQVVFVFTLLLVASGVIQGSPEERGYVPPEDWKTLISLFDVDPKKDVSAQVREIDERYRRLKKEHADATRDNDRLLKEIARLDKWIADLEKKKTGAPGLPPCRTRDGTEELVVHASIDRNGVILTKAATQSQAQEIAALLAEIEGVPIRRERFPTIFSKVREAGLARSPQCKYAATVTYDPIAPAGEYQPSISAIVSVFRINQISRRKSE